MIIIKGCRFLKRHSAIIICSIALFWDKSPSNNQIFHEAIHYFRMKGDYINWYKNYITSLLELMDGDMSLYALKEAYEAHEEEVVANHQAQLLEWEYLTKYHYLSIGEYLDIKSKNW